MTLRKEIERYLILIQTLESSFQIAKELKRLPLSFFSATRDHLDLLKEELSRIEELQSQTFIPEKEIIPDEIEGNNSEEPIEQEENVIVEELLLEEEIIVEETIILADEIEKKIHPDFRSSLTLNDRFRFQRNLFNGNVELMTQTLNELNDFNSMDEALSYLSSFDWDWEDESVQAFREILEKRFD
jgi:hypothetical protein